tara:strand:+ start:12398 stop:12571 length:174 start_codon:yes stop_codon:yes gene_type:complete
MTAQEYDCLPQAVKDTVDTWDENLDMYAECERIIQELKHQGWSFDYDLSGQIFFIKK